MKRFFLEDIQTKIFALILALFFWAFIKMQFVSGKITAVPTAIEHTYVQVPVSIMQQPFDKNIYDLDVLNAAVTVSGNRNIIKSISKEKIILYVTVDPDDVVKVANSQGNSTNSNTLLKKIQYNIPSDLNLKNIDPAVVRVTYGGNSAIVEPENKATEENETSEKTKESKEEKTKE